GRRYKKKIEATLRCDCRIDSHALAGFISNHTALIIGLSPQFLPLAPANLVHSLTSGKRLRSPLSGVSCLMNTLRAKALAGSALLLVLLFSGCATQRIDW